MPTVIPMRLVLVLMLFAAPAVAQPTSAPARSARKVVWDGERVFPKSFGHVEPKEKNAFQPQTDEVHQGKVALELVIQRATRQDEQAIARAGWNWHGWWPEDSGDDLTAYTHLVFWVKVEPGKKIDKLEAGLESSKPRLRSVMVDVTRYCPAALDGQWHEIAIPAADLTATDNKFNPKLAWELRIESRSASTEVPYSIYLDEIAFETRPTSQPAGNN